MNADRPVAGRTLRPGAQLLRVSARRIIRSSAKFAGRRGTTHVERSNAN
jgi:hypothetical protein